MQGNPINSFVFWEINSEKIKNSFKFYEFLKSYRAFFAEDNPDIDTKSLTALYIGLKDSYAYKMPRKWWRDDEECLPIRRLYVNLANRVGERSTCKELRQKVFSGYTLFFQVLEQALLLTNLIHQ